MSKKKKAKGIQDIVDDIDKLCDEEVFKIIRIAYGKRKGNINGAFPYRIDPKLIDLVINRLCNMIFEFASKGKWKKKPPIPFKPLLQMLEFAEKDIDAIYKNAVKKIGFSSRIINPEKKWRDSALKYFDENRDKFKAIRREYLLDKSLYTLNSGKEKRDFKAGLFTKVVEDPFQDFYTISGRRILEDYKKSKKEA